MTLAEFIAYWSESGGAERANKDSPLRDLCDALDLPRPEKTTGDPERDSYVFEADAPTRLATGAATTRKIDLYKAGCFIREAKQGSEHRSPKLGTARRLTPARHLAIAKSITTGNGSRRRPERGTGGRRSQRTPADRRCHSAVTAPLGPPIPKPRANPSPYGPSGSHSASGSAARRAG